MWPYTVSPHPHTRNALTSPYGARRGLSVDSGGTVTLEKLPSDDLWKLLSVFDDLLAIEKGLAKVLGLFELQWSSITRRDVILELFERQAGL